MTQVATVVRRINDHYAEISVDRETACGHDCEKCAGCGVAGAPVHADAQNLIGAEPGDKVVVESSTKKVLGVVAMVYVFPFVGFFIALAIGIGALHLGQLAGCALGGVGFVLCLLPAFFYNRRVKVTKELDYRIVRMF